MAKREDKAYKTSIGGQALIEGIYMRGPFKQSTVVRSENGIVSKVEDVHPIKDRFPILGWPLIRGTVSFLTSMITGVKSINYSAEIAFDDAETEEPSKFDLWIEKHFGSEKAQKIFIGLAVVLGIAFSIGLFILLPAIIAEPLKYVTDKRVFRNLLEGAIRIVIFLIYMVLVSKMQDIKRVFRYHGAEHKTIYCYENGLELTVENVRKQKKEHPRCGTSFVFIVMIVSIFVFSVVSWNNVWIKLLLRLVLLPVVVGISYEISKWTGGHDNWLSTVLAAPGKALQKITTSEPDDSMIEVAIEALKLVIPEEKGTDRW